MRFKPQHPAKTAVSKEVWQYQKPDFICKPAEEIFPELIEDPIQFAIQQKELIKSVLHGMGFTIRLANMDDILPTEQFILDRYDPKIAGEVSPFDMFRFIKYGHGVVLHPIENPKAIQGCIFGVRYHSPEMESYTVRLGIDKGLKGMNLGAYVMLYSCFHAMSEGARTKTGIIDFDNCISLYLNLNKVGWICPKFYPENQALGPYLDILLPLDVKGMSSNVVDTDKTMEYMRHAEEGKDYMVVNSADFEALKHMYGETDFVAVAMLGKGMPNDQCHFFALPAETIHLKRID